MVLTVAAAHVVLPLAVGIFCNLPLAQSVGAASETSTHLVYVVQPVVVLSDLEYPLSSVGQDVQLAAPAPEYFQFAHVEHVLLPSALAVPAEHCVQLGLYVPPPDNVP